MFMPQMTDFNLSELDSSIDLCKTVDRLMERTDQISVRGMEDPSGTTRSRIKSKTGLLHTVPFEWVTTEARSCKCHRFILPKTNHSVRCGLCGSAVEYPYIKRELKSRSEETIKAELKEIVDKHREEEAEKAAIEKAKKDAIEDARRGYPALRRALAERDKAEHQAWLAKNNAKINQRLKDIKATAAPEELTLTPEEFKANMTGIRMMSLIFEALTGIDTALQKDEDRIQGAELEAIRRIKRLFAEPVDAEVKMKEGELDYEQN